MPSTLLENREGQLTPQEALEWSAIDQPNMASERELAQRSYKAVENCYAEWSDRLTRLHKRWRGIYYMLAGNSLDTSGPADIHMPEIYKAIETLVPRIEEAILERDPWFRIVPRRYRSREKAETLAAYMDWQFGQSRVQDLIQPAIRNLLVTQTATFYTQWDTKIERRTSREIETELGADGVMRRRLNRQTGDRVTYYGPKTWLVDPFDFIIDTKATNPQDASYVGHRMLLTVDEIRRIGQQFGWANLDDLEQLESGAFSNRQDYYRWPRDPASLYSDENMRYANDGRPNKVELVVLYLRFDLERNGNYQDVRIVVSGGKQVHEVRVNPYDGGLRPYATARAVSSGHEFYGVGNFDNAVRLSQHLDRYCALLFRMAELTAGPITFVEEDAELPDNLYRVKPFKVFTGTGPVRFQQIPDGALRAGPMVVGMMQRNIEETVGAFRIQMGQDLNGGTATEATLSLQEGNRRTRGLIRALGNGLEQLLHVYHRMNQMYSFADIEFPVLGKRAIDLRRTSANLRVEELVEDVEFDLVGLHSLRTNGLKATGMQALSNSMMPLIMANAPYVNGPTILHDFTRELVGPEEADRYIRVPTPPDQLRSQEEENEGLWAGQSIEIDPDDDDTDHMLKLRPLYERALDKDSKMDNGVRGVVIEHYLGHHYQRQRKAAQQRSLATRPAQTFQTAPEAGGQPAADGSGRTSPTAGGMSNALMDLAMQPGGQTPSENPGPADIRKSPRAGRARRPVSQMENAL